MGKKKTILFRYRFIMIVLKEKGNLITVNQKLANLFSTYFINITNTLRLKNSPSKFQSLS